MTYAFQIAPPCGWKWNRKKKSTTQRSAPVFSPAQKFRIDWPSGITAARSFGRRSATQSTPAGTSARPMRNRSRGTFSATQPPARSANMPLP